METIDGKVWLKEIKRKDVGMAWHELAWLGLDWGFSFTFMYVGTDKTVLVLLIVLFTFPMLE